MLSIDAPSPLLLSLTTLKTKCYQSWQTAILLLLIEKHIHI